jgi:hypothetical protein
VPEPATVTLLGVFAVGFSAYVLQKRKAKK